MQRDRIRLHRLARLFAAEVFLVCSKKRLFHVGMRRGVMQNCMKNQVIRRLWDQSFAYAFDDQVWWFINDNCVRKKGFDRIKQALPDFIDQPIV